MKTNKIDSNGIAESKVINAMDEITRATKKVLMDYVISMYLVSFAKVTAEVEHILTVSGMEFEQDYKIIKKYLLDTNHEFAEKIIKDFREETPIFRKKLNKCIFNFDDILMLDNRAIQKIIQEVDQQTLAKALKGTDPEIQDKFFANMCNRDACMLKEDMEWMGPVRLSDVETCQAEILKIIFRLEDKGEIVISKIRISDILVD